MPAQPNLPYGTASLTPARPEVETKRLFPFPRGDGCAGSKELTPTEDPNGEVGPSVLVLPHSPNIPKATPPQSTDF